MLSDKEREEIEAEMARYPHKRAMVPEALRIVQTHRGWISDESVRDVAELMGMSAEEIDTIASSYNMIFRRPVGRHVILYCDNVSCWIMRSDAVRDHLVKRLAAGPGETTKDGRYTVLPSACLGDCHHAPVMMVDDEMHGNLTPEKIDRILERYT